MSLISILKPLAAENSKRFFECSKPVEIRISIFFCYIHYYALKYGSGERLCGTASKYPEKIDKSHTQWYL